MSQNGQKYYKPSNKNINKIKIFVCVCVCMRAHARMCANVHTVT